MLDADASNGGTAMTSTRLDPPSIARGAKGLLDSPYAVYLNVATLYDIQGADKRAGELRHPEELLFRTVHQACELWLRLAGFEIEGADADVGAGELLRAVRRIDRACGCFNQVTEATKMLQSMPTEQYHRFRTSLGDASGIQSPGYAYVKQAANRLASALDTAVGDDDALFRLYTEQVDTPLYAVCEAMLDLDVSVDRFRSTHVHIAQRFLGEDTKGTAGQGIGYLRGVVGHQFFSRLWTLRGRIADAAGATVYGYGESEAEID
jgi:tryptophan 2,3-dioxygenase